MDKERIGKFKHELARALDDNLHTRQWHNVVDWLIIAMILLSTIEIFLSTFHLAPGVHRALKWVEIVTLVFFTVEVSARIWVAPLVNPAWKGWKGRLRYCFSFYGFIDILSTFPFYLQWLFPLPVTAFRALRTARVIRTLRIGRYSKSFTLLSSAIREKRRELMVSMQFLVIITFILSLILYFAEHEAQPDVYDNGAVSVIWAFAQYIGDPGQFADTPPVTHPGRIVACIVGLLGIAIVAVPTGIIGAGFTDAIEKRNHREEVESDAARLRCGFETKLDRPTGFQAVPPFRTVEDLKVRLGMKSDNLREAVAHGPGFRMVNLAATMPTDVMMPRDIVAVEHYPQNTAYGCCIDRQSRVTIVAPSNMVDPGLSWFAYYLSLIGGFNYISREIGERAPYRSYYAFDAVDLHTNPGLKEYAADLQRLASRPGAWTLTVLAASGLQEPVYPTNIHLAIGGPKGDTRTAGPGLFVSDGETYTRFYSALEKAVGPLGLTLDHQLYHDTSSERNIMRRIDLAHDSNHIIMRIEWKQILWSSARLKFARTIADTICRAILGTPPPPPPPTLSKKTLGYPAL